MKLGLLASGVLGHQALQHIHDRYELVFVCTDSRSDNIKDFAQKHDIPLFVGNPRNSRITRFIEDKEIDVLASVNYLFLIEQDLIQLPSVIAFNIHGSLLPKYRGRTPHVWAIINSEKEVGITAHLIDENCDAGDILCQIHIPIEEKDTGASLLEKYTQRYPELLDRVFEQIEGESLDTIPQDESKATYFGKRGPSDGKIDWNWQRERVYNWIRAQAPPYPGAFSFYKGRKIIFESSQFSEDGFNYEQPNGTILKTDPLTVKTPNGALELTLANTEEAGGFKIGERFEYKN